MFSKFLIFLALATICNSLSVEKKKISNTKLKPGLKHKTEDPSKHLEFEIDNLVEPDAPKEPILISDDLLPPPPSQDEEEQALEEEEEAEKEDIFPDRVGFITGHRIPPEILDKIKNSNSKYVDASNFRNRNKEVADKHQKLFQTSQAQMPSHLVSVEPPSTDIELPKQEVVYPKPDTFLSPPPSPRVNKALPAASSSRITPQRLVEEGLGSEEDTVFLRTLDSFVPDYY